MKTARTAAIVLVLMASGCFKPPTTKRPAKPTPTPNPIVVPVPDAGFDPMAQSAALARLAERQAKSASIHDGTRRLQGILNELVVDGVPQAYVDSVRAAVPAIKIPTKDSPARNLTPEEIAALKGVGK